MIFSAKSDKKRALISSAKLPLIESKKPKIYSSKKQKTILLKTKILIKFVFSLGDIEKFQKKIKGGIKRSGKSLIHSFIPCVKLLE